jgi:hypothetical protein
MIATIPPGRLSAGGGEDAMASRWYAVFGGLLTATCVATVWATLVLAELLFLPMERAHAVDPDECNLQRAQYPRNWKDVSQEKALFDCQSHYAGGLAVRLGANDNAGRAMMSLVEQQSKKVHRIWLDKEQVEHLKDGRYFATIVRQETSCWIRGDLNKGSVFLMDNADPPADGLRPDAAAFYNKAPRFSVFQGNAYECKSTK